MANLKVYLAGPDVFLPDAKDVGLEKKRLCEEFGFQGLFPFDNEISENESKVSISREIYKANIKMIKSADFGIFNLTPFRGISADAGTIFELGFSLGLDKPVFGYSNDDNNMLERVSKKYHLNFDDSRNAWIDEFNMSVENFQNADNLMIDCAIADQGRGIHKLNAEN